MSTVPVPRRAHRRVATSDLATREEFGDFELEWEWKVASGGDARVFYRGTESYDRIYWSAVEYQLQDDAAPPDGPSRLAGAGAVYGLYPARAGVVQPAGEWNVSRIGRCSSCCGAGTSRFRT